LEELKSLKSRLDDDNTAWKVIAPALLLIQAERLGVDEETLRYFAAVASGAIGGDGHVSAAMKKVELACGRRAVALLWGATFAAHSIRTKMGGRWECVESYRVWRRCRKAGWLILSLRASSA
jgi:hypothetical protein